jgi:hypothetical protein
MIASLTIRINDGQNLNKTVKYEAFSYTIISFNYSYSGL